MRGWTIGWLVWIATATAFGFPVWPLLSTPGVPHYLQVVPEIVAGAEREVLVALSDCRKYEEGSTEPLLAVLEDAAARGVGVWVVVEQRADDPPLPEQRLALQTLAQAGCQVRWDDPQVTLHSKLLVIDSRAVVLGSTHWTYSGLTNSVQVDLVLESGELASLAREFFWLIWEGELDAQAQLPSAPWPPHAVLPLLELPGSGLHSQVLSSLIQGAQSSLDVLVYKFGYYPQYRASPSNALVEGILDALRRGVKVRVLMESGERFPDLYEANRLTATYLALSGAEVRFDPPGETLHAKCLVVDGRHLVVSSANWSYYSLERNVEAGVAVLDAPALAARLQQFFERLWEQS